MAAELQRVAYLRAMDIDCLVPRLLLPGAKPSIQCPVELDGVLEGVDADEAVGAGETEPGNPPATSASGAGAAQQLFEQPPETPRSTRPLPSAAAPPAVGTAAPRFALSVTRAGDLLIVDDGLQPNCDPQAYQALLANLVFAIVGVNVTPVVEAFHWPLRGVRGGHVDHSASAAVETLGAYLSRRLEQAAASRLLVLGNTAAEWLAETGQLQPAHTGVRVCAVPTSAVSALLNPAYKPELWQQLQGSLATFRGDS